MTLPTSGPISMRQVNIELTKSPAQTISFNDNLTRFLAAEIVPGESAGGATPNSIDSMQELLGKSYIFTFHFTSANNQDLATAAVAAGWDNYRPLVCVVPNGVVVGSISTSTPALTVTGSFPNGVTLVVENGGYIVGAGGIGGSSVWAIDVKGLAASVNGGNGGPALAISAPVIIQNLGTIGGGGGGGGQGYCGDHQYWTLMDGPGGGGAGTFVSGAPLAVTTGSGGYCYSALNNGDNRYYAGSGYYVVYGVKSAQNGGLSTGGLGAVGYSPDPAAGFQRQSGSGQLYSSSLVSTLSSDGVGYCVGGNGGGLGQSGGNGYSVYGDGNQGVGGAPGNAISGIGYVTWSGAPGNVYGPTS
jgi:hypothetical protein